jgi:D-3-phosphoglycerate dehydrogenase
MTRVLVATEKPFAPIAITRIKKIVEDAGFELVLLEKYKDPADFIKAAADVDALIIRSDIASREVIQTENHCKSWCRL